MEVSHNPEPTAAGRERTSANPVYKERSTPSRLGIALSSLKTTSNKFTDKLERLDDGIIDASEVAAVVDDLVKEQALQRVYKFVAIGLFIVVIVLIGALTGITWAIVQLSKETKMTQYSTTTYQLMTTKARSQRSFAAAHTHA
ncbi:hypothetical protein GPECTOR_12g354 [Gonium pectorale]|uniref:Uncharacterized protein n=1 Tax=Gonium pectorale TaxID=33097 RepID=A0A150GNS7_GONPE|nr:hypothetical protein GPECTOR_12g354 [Gonium pectorale]|eukprot:KXZ51392.1 hypothetical protein GPECTOR_12g354 [Gonium pectorale]